MLNSTLVSEPVAASPAVVSSPATDLDWVKETLQGSSQAFGNLISKYQPRFFRMANRILKNEQEAEDVVQDAFMAAYRNLSKFQNKARFSTWLYSIVLNHVHNRLRHQKVVRWVPLDGNSNQEDSHSWDVADKEVGFDTVLEQRIELEEIQQAITNLSLQHQTVFTLHYFKGLNLGQISAQLKRPLGTIKADLHRARKNLAHVLAQKYSSPE